MTDKQTIIIMLANSNQNFIVDNNSVLLKDKDVEGIIQTLVLHDDLVVVTEPDSERAASAEIVAEKVSAKFVTAISDSELALKTALALKQENSILCVAGSLYLIGKIRSLLKANL